MFKDPKRTEEASVIEQRSSINIFISSLFLNSSLFKDLPMVTHTFFNSQFTKLRFGCNLSELGIGFVASDVPLNPQSLQYSELALTLP